MDTERVEPRMEYETKKPGPNISAWAAAWEQRLRERGHDPGDRVYVERGTAGQLIWNCGPYTADFITGPGDAAPEMSAPLAADAFADSMEGRNVGF